MWWEMGTARANWLTLNYIIIYQAIELRQKIEAGLVQAYQIYSKLTILFF